MIDATTPEVQPDAFPLGTLNRIATGEWVDPAEVDLARGYFGLDLLAASVGEAHPSEPEPEATLTLSDWLALQVENYKSFGTEAGDLVADHLSDLLSEVHILDAKTPDQLWDRRAVMARYHG